MDSKEFPEEIPSSYSVSVEELDTFYGQGNWRRLPDETFKRLLHTNRNHGTEKVQTVEVYVGTDGDHQDEFLRVSVQNTCFGTVLLHHHYWHRFLIVKYANSSALHRIEQEFERNGVNISRQTMSNWIMRCSEKYFCPICGTNEGGTVISSCYTVG